MTCNIFPLTFPICFGKRDDQLKLVSNKNECVYKMTDKNEVVFKLTDKNEGVYKIKSVDVF